eukprot:gnl/TRDRNA2_/TRDRNA2_179032_c0_seq1.p1 gnl/TRDRNA2_/TRDRNA2_179032_c0~~gnl/TRDRNA2_/TRDRNA2_179032_c0_seq1.p1  ORF type:complete len:751 (-),score=218.05 gnl/TRDRNA2_/TRDRNA2_179032_c0_seq1:158-2410(-)
MRIFINNVDSFVGQALCHDLRRVLDQDNRIMGTVINEAVDVDTEQMSTLGVKRVVFRKDKKQYFKDLLSCSLIVFDLHSAVLDEVEAVIKELKLAALDHQTTFVLISSVNVWAMTKREYEPVRGEGEEDEEEPPPEEEGEDAPVKIVKKRPKELTDADLDRRIPSPEYEPWKYLEMLALSLEPKEKLRPHVIAAGILYGNGETVFNDLFKAAWLTQSTHVVISPGDNYIPCVHVRDVARLVKVVAADSKVGRYLLAVDKARSTQAEIVQGIVNKIGRKGTEVPVVNEEEVTSEFKDILMLDLILKPSAPMRAKNFAWWCKKGLVANLDKVAAEFCKWRNLCPVKMVVVGPPGSGAEKFCKMVADRYLHEDPPHWSFDQILQDAIAEKSKAARKLRRKVERLAAKGPGAKLPLKDRTKIVKKRLLSNVCRFRGFVLEGYPETFEEAQDLFTELRLMNEDGVEELVGGEEEEAEEEGGEAEAEGEEEEAGEEEEEEPPPPAEVGPSGLPLPESFVDEEDEGGDPKPVRRLNKDIGVEFVVVLKSTEEQCKNRLFSGEVSGSKSAEEFALRSAEYRKNNLAEDGSPGVKDFFEETGNVKVLDIDVDASADVDLFNTVRVYIESKGQFFNYLRTEEEIVRARAEETAEREIAADLADAQAAEELKVKEADERRRREAEQQGRLQKIAAGEASLLETEALPLRQYLMSNVVPTLSDGLIEVCKVMPDDPIDYLAEYLFQHAQDIAPQLEQRNRNR